MIELLRNALSEQVDAGLDFGIGFASGLHCFEGEPLVVVLVGKLAIGEGVEDVAKLLVLNAAHGFGRSADGVVDLGEDEVAAFLFFAL